MKTRYTNLCKVLSHVRVSMFDEKKHSIFDCNEIPQISITNYVSRIIEYTECSQELLDIAIRYMSLFSEKYTITSRRVHCVFFTAYVIAQRTLLIHHPCSAAFAKIGGIPSKRLNNMVSVFRRIINYQLYFLKPIDITKCYANILDAEIVYGDEGPRPLDTVLVHSHGVVYAPELGIVSDNANAVI